MKETGLFIDGDDYDATVEKLETIIEIMKDCDIYEKEIYEAVLNNDNKVRMCVCYNENDSTLDCGKHRCNNYTPKNGKNGCCKFNHKVEYTAGKTFIVNQKGELVQIVRKQLWVARQKDGNLLLSNKKPILESRGVCGDLYWTYKGDNDFIKHFTSQLINYHLFPEITYDNSPQETEITIKIKQKQN